MDSHGNLIFIDQDRSFFHGGRPRTTSNTKHGIDHPDDASGIRSPLIQATLAIPGVAEDLAEYISRVEAMPDAIYEGLARNASYYANQLCSLFYVDISLSSAMASLGAMEQWIEKLVARKRRLRKSIVRRLREVLRTTSRL